MSSFLQPPLTYRFSKFTKRYSRAEVVALYHSLRMEVVYIPVVTLTALEERLRSIDVDGEAFLSDGSELGAVVEGLIAKSFLVPEDFSEAKQLQAVRDGLIAKPALEIMYLLLTDDCNLRCRYCFLESPACPIDFRAIRMTESTARAAVETFARLTARYGRAEHERFIQFYGGEPLLNWRVLRMAVEHIHGLRSAGHLPSKTSVVLITNGTIMTRGIARFLATYDVSVGVSLDGDATLTNAYRVDTRGVGVYSRVRRGIDILREAGVRVGISCTLTPRGIERFDELLAHLIDEIGVPEGFSFNLLHFSPGVPVGEQYYIRAAERLIRAYSLFRTKGIYEERMMRKVGAFVHQVPLYADCGVTANQIVVAPDGSIGVCQDFVKPRRYFPGSVFNPAFDPLADNVFLEWQKRSPLNMPQCFDCPALAICGGGCGASAELQFGSKWEIDRRICPHSLTTLEWLIWDLYAQITQGSFSPSHVEVDTP
jgi:uncharacterized protein